MMDAVDFNSKTPEQLQMMRELYQNLEIAERFYNWIEDRYDDREDIHRIMAWIFMKQMSKRYEDFMFDMLMLHNEREGDLTND